MKKLMIAASAVALAFGLRADFATVGENFNELTDVPSTITDKGESTISSVAYSYSKLYQIGEPDQFRGVPALNNYNIKTAFNAPTWYNLESTYTLSSQLYFDSLVKFTACDEAPADTDISGAKIVVWVKEDDSGDTVTKTLMITAGKLVNDEPVRADYACGAPTDYGIADDSDWCRLTIKAVKDITINSGIPGFVVFVNGQAVTIDTPKDIGIEETELTQNMKLWKRYNRLFPSLVGQDITISKVGFAGQGAVDDISFTVAEPTDVVETTFAKDELAEIATVGTVKCTDVAAINEEIAKATTGATVTLLDNVTGTLAFNTEASFVLDLNGQTLTGVGQDVTAIDSTFTTEAGKLKILDSKGGGKVDGLAWTTAAATTIVSGKFRVAENQKMDDVGSVVDSENYQFVKCDDDAYWTVAEILENGTEAKPWKIGTAQDFTDKVIDNAPKGHYFVQTADITLTGTFAGIGAAKTDAGESMKDMITTQEFKDKAFRGNYDGGGFTVKGLVLQAGGDYVGFFNSCYQATIKNLKVAIGGDYGWSDQTTADSVGAVIVGIAAETTLENCSTVVDGENDTFKATKTAGGIVGYASNGTVLLDCANNLNIWSVKNKKAGGLVACVQNPNGSTFVGDGLIVSNCASRGYVKTESDGSEMAGLVAYADMKVTFKGANVFSGEVSVANGTAQTVVYVAGSGNIVIDDGATFTVPAAYSTTNQKVIDGLNVATVSDGVATLIKDAALVKGGSYKVMTPATISFELAAVGDSITIDNSMVGFVNVTTSVNDAYVNKVDYTWTVTEKTTPTITIEGIPEITEYTTGLTFPEVKVTVAGDLEYTASWNPQTVVEPEAGTTNTYTYTVSVEATKTTKAAEQAATWLVFKAAASGGLKPGEVIPCDTKDEAEKKAAVTPVVIEDKDAADAGQADVVKSAAVQDASGNWYVKPVINTEAEAYKAPEVAVAEVATQLSNIAASSEGDEVSVPVAAANATPGLYYSLDTSTDLGDFVEGERVLATGDGVTLKATKPAGSKAFFRVSEHMTKTPANK